MTMREIRGNTYPVRMRLKGIGAQWDKGKKLWVIQEAKYEEAMAIVGGSGAKKPAGWEPCGYPGCYWGGPCDQCDGDGETDEDRYENRFTQGRDYEPDYDY
ncbi:MAG: hypothetical protein MUP21_14320 [Dehalococcoidia bacterium]|nr:hypothetical protein [Dehalococcoidia bacterium]